MTIFIFKYILPFVFAGLPSAFAFWWPWAYHEGAGCEGGEGHGAYGSHTSQSGYLKSSTSSKTTSLPSIPAATSPNLAGSTSIVNATSGNATQQDLWASVPCYVSNVSATDAANCQTVLLRRCAISNASEHFINNLAEFQSQENATLHKRDVLEELTVPLYIHWVESEAISKPNKDPLLEVLNEQLSVLNGIFDPINITLNLLGTTFTTNDNWAYGKNDTEMKLALRNGTYDTLNMYFQTNLEGNNTDGDGTSTTLGFCTYPTSGVTNTTDRTAYITDGCNMLASTMPNGTYNYYNLGYTAAHEAGHWFGLLHTFQGTSCDADNPGDYVDDTRQEGSSTSGCPTGKNTCPQYEGMDPVHNIMDYSQDSCYRNLTAGQGARIRTVYASMRAGR